MVRTPIQLIQDEPSLFLGVGNINQAILGCVISDVIESEPRSFTIEVSDDVCAVVCDVDWMDVDGFNVKSLFENFVPPRVSRPNSHRSEVIVAAMSKSLITYGNCGEFCSGEEVEFLRNASSKFVGARVLIWKSR